ncbi:helicase-related protein [Candidatus Kuenenia stuttgartiensis]|uniref:helicase-related protein n=1 Tax=Kuenenia stuttgartiensis TaxID=174633 RepID=UPI00197AF7D0|nr:helicase-related protein [Candidatus Kuenenia stuttgartiensis]
MNSDLTFITNEENRSLLERFRVLIADTRLFDVLVGYFYTSGFHAIYKSLEDTEKIRILIGISTNKQAIELIQKAKNNHQPFLPYSHAEVKEQFEQSVTEEVENAEDRTEVEGGILKFIEWLKNGKLEIRAYPTENIHAKLYIMTFVEGDRDTGRVITGSSNFTQSGLVDNLEFNVELKTRADYEFALQKFNELWKDAVDVRERYIYTIQIKTWRNNTITPYELYLKFLYEYFKDELSQADEVFLKYLPHEFKKLEYQEQAVLNARKILLEYGGVFISDVVGLGKTYISAMLAGQLDGRTLVIAPPVLLERSNPGSWTNVFSDFRVSADFESLGKLDDLIDRGTEKYTNIIIDEAHRFRTETTVTYEKLAEICRGKRIVLVTATPYNNAPKDILSLLKLFQKAKKSTIPNLQDMEGFFNGLDKKLKKLDRQKDYIRYINTVKENARELREKVLKYLMVRRTRTEIERYFGEDIKSQNIRFPYVEKPVPLFYELNDTEDEIFSKTIALIAQKFKYARYMPMLYYDGKVGQLEKQSQKNMGKFMKILLVKRLESSFFAFKNSVDRFLRSYEMFIKELDDGSVYISKKHTGKIFELLDSDDDEAVQRLIEEGKAERYASSEFREGLREDLLHDHDILLEIKKLWHHIDRDPKLLKFLGELSLNPVLKANHLIIFTESKETANYLFKNINEHYPDNVLCFTGDSGEATRDKVIENFDAKSRHPKEDYRILVSTEVLAEGVNLHRSNTVINYDIPWNPTRMMQRVGRVNRVDTLFETIHTFNFFPTKQSNDQIKLKEAAEAKINAFLTLLGGDAELLTEGEPIGSHELFNRLISRQTLEGEEGSEESELKYLQVIKEIRDKDPDLFEKIKRLPKKARTAKTLTGFSTLSGLITYFRRGKLQKFFKAGSKNVAEELDFISAAKILESAPDEEKKDLPGHFYELLDKNKAAFILATTEEVPQQWQRGGRDSTASILRILKATTKNTQKLTEDQELYLKKVLTQLEEGGLPKQTATQTLKTLNALKNEIVNPLKVLAVLRTHIPKKLLEEHYAEQNPAVFGKREVILSLYLTAKP